MKRLPQRTLSRILVIIWPVVSFFTGSIQASAQSTLTGIVTHSLSGAGIVGARVTVNGMTTRTITGGIYSITVIPGTYPVTCAKPGFDTMLTAPLTFQQGSTVTWNFQLEETACAPAGGMALLDPYGQSVQITWEEPEGQYEALYDDGIQDNFTVWAVQGNMNGVRFTPLDWPVKITGGSVHIGNSSNYQPGSNPLVPFQVAVYKANGTGGMPGTLIGGPYDVIPLALGWVDFTFPDTVVVSAGDYYLVMIQGGNAPNAAGIAVDLTASQFRSVQRFVTGGGPWTPAGGNFMLRALAIGAGGPALLKENGESLTGYKVWRLRQGEEQNPVVWTELGETSNLTFTDPGWPSFPCGPYIWGIKAGYTGNRWSPVAFTNILPKCWTSGVTVVTSLTCEAGNKGGTGVRLKNMVYPDTCYNATLDTSGTIQFPSVWKGTYELRLVKFGYDEQSFTLPVSHDTTVGVLLLQENPPPRELEVGEKSLVAHWLVPEYKKDFLYEEWSSAGFTENGWTREGGYNWVISTVTGNPLPSAMFGWSPQVVNYSQTLTSREINTENAPVITLKYDIMLDNFGTTTENQMALEAWDGMSWNVLATYDNQSGSLPWYSAEQDLSSYSGLPLRIRFRATGGNSFDINGWYVDNILVSGSETAAGLANCILGYNVYLDNVLSGFTTDSKYTIPGEQVQYGQPYNCCVNAVYGSGWSENVCVLFTSLFLWPPLNLGAEIIENSVLLSWDQPEMPDTAGQMVTPPGLTGYRIYRNSQLIDSVADPGTVTFYDLQLEPGTYEYEVSAWYDLTEYGLPGQYDESMRTGPVTVEMNYGRPLPFIETWGHASFLFNEWQFVPSQGNWTINTAEGEPLPCAEFSRDPALSIYKHQMRSPALDGTPYQCGNIFLDFDLCSGFISPTGEERLTAEIYYDDEWHTLGTFLNDTALEWLHVSYDISDAAGKGFLIGFTASGNNSQDILQWRVDNIYAYAVCFGPTGLQGDVQGYDVHLSWIPPDCTGANIYLDEDFEGLLFPPVSWTRITNDPVSTWTHTNALSPVGVHGGEYSAGLLWDYNHQDEWLIAQNVIVNGNLTFWSYAYQGSVHNDHYYVKISADEGQTWDVLLDLSALPPYPGPGGYNQWNEPYVVDLSAYLGDVVSIAWHATDGDGQGLWYSWAIDDCKVGDVKRMPGNDPSAGNLRNTDAPAGLLGYDVFRRDSGYPEFLKINTNTVSDTFYIDQGLDPGEYEYFISPVFAECNLSYSSDTILTDVVTGQEEQMPKTEVEVYPVPASAYIYINTNFDAVSAELFSLTGTLLLQMNADGYTNIMNVSQIAHGTYLLRIRSESGSYYRKVVIK